MHPDPRLRTDAADGTRAAFLLLLLLAASIGAPVARAADAPRVANPAVPRDGSSALHLEETWRAGGPDDDVVFGMITQVRSDEAGNLYVMDAQLSQVHVYSPEGRRLRTLFREGDGPGEIRGPRDIVLLDDGRVGAVQEIPGKLVFVDRQGDPAGSLTIGGAGTSPGGFCQTFSAFAGGGLLLVAGFIQAPGAEPGHFAQTSFLSGFDAQGNRRIDFASTVNDLDPGNFVFAEDRHLAPFWWNAAVGPDGRVCVAPDLARYEIMVHAPDGTLERVITREYEPWRRTRADKERFTDMVRAVYHGLPFEIGVAPSDVEPVILYLHRGLRLHDDGTLWVLTTRGVREPADGAMASFDVFDRDGVFVRRVDVHGPWNGATDGVFLFGDDRAVVVTGFADAMLTQFTGGNLSVDLPGDAGSMEVVGCRVRRD